MVKIFKEYHPWKEYGLLSYHLYGSSIGYQLVSIHIGLSEMLGKPQNHIWQWFLFLNVGVKSSMRQPQLSEPSNGDESKCWEPGWQMSEWQPGCRKLAEKTGYFDAPTNKTWPVHSTIADYRWQHTTEGRALTFTIFLLTTEVLPIPGENPRFRFRSWPSPLGGSLGISVGMMEMPKKLLTKAWKSRKLSAEFHRGSR